mmetsp:Transcript_3992/g.12742  ORF Transcript_3992/g.12742 Transcript_3992/m.12742 type:complete len:270 (-) Transcript_3992:350-1159(-)
MLWTPLGARLVGVRGSCKCLRLARRRAGWMTRKVACMRYLRPSLACSCLSCARWIPPSCRGTCTWIPIAWWVGWWTWVASCPPLCAEVRLEPRGSRCRAGREAWWWPTMNPRATIGLRLQVVTSGGHHCCVAPGAVSPLLGWANWWRCAGEECCGPLAWSARCFQMAALTCRHCRCRCWPCCMARSNCCARSTRRVQVVRVWPRRPLALSFPWSSDASAQWSRQRALRTRPLLLGQPRWRVLRNAGCRLRGCAQRTTHGAGSLRAQRWT